MILSYTIEIAMGLLSVIATLLMYLIKRTNNRVDKLDSDLQDHRVEDARHYITRVEHDNKLEILKADIREMVGSIGESVRNIENYIRDQNKKS
jgi:hypothetical protein